MGLINLLRTGKWSKQASSANEDLKLSVGSTENKPSVNHSIKNRPRQPVSVLHYKHTMTARGWPFQTGHDFIGPIYNLGEIAKVLDIDAYFSASVRRHRELIMKEGWHWTSKNQEAIKYIKKRMSEIAMISGEPISCMIREGLTNIVAYGTSIFVLKRDSSRSSGGSIRLFGRRLEPISGIYSADPSTMAVKKNDFGRPVSWRQKVSGEEGKTKIFHHNDVVLSTLDRKSGFTFGTPYVIPVLDDIRALRRLEELVELVTHKNTFPFFHAKVGTEKMPAGYVTSPDGTQIGEVDLVRGQIDNMPPEGGLVTSERVEIAMLGQQGQVLDLKPYLEHFENRVMGGLRLSGIDLGRGDTANKSTAQTVTKNLVDACTEIRNVFSEIWDSKINDILLLEGGFDINEDNRVHLKFPEIDREEMRAHQNHGQQLFMNNLVSEDEFRRDYLGKEPIEDEERKKTNFELYTKTMAIISAVDEPHTAEAKASSRAVANKSQPANQFGVATTKKRVAANDGHDHRRMDPNIMRRYYLQLDYYWIELMKELQDSSDSIVKNGKMLSKDGHIKNLVHGYTTLMVGDAKKHLTPIVELGYKHACLDLDVKFNMSKDVFYHYFNKYVKTQLIKINRKATMMLGLDVESGRKVGRTATKFDIAGVFQALSPLLKQAGAQQADLAYKIGYMEALKRNKQENVFVVPDKINAPDDWADQDSRVLSLDVAAKRDFMDLDLNRRYLILAETASLEE